MSRRQESANTAITTIYDEMISPAGKGLADRPDTISLIDTFLADRLSPSTRKVYKSYIRALFDMMDEKDLKEVTTDDVLTYRDSLIGNFDPVTIASRLNVLRNFFQFCVGSGLLEQNPVKDVKPPKTLEYNSAVRLTQDQVEVLLRQPDRFSLVGKRDYALLCLMIYNGLLASEIVGIRWGDLQWKDDHILLRFRCRGRKETISRIEPHLMDVIIDYKESCNRTFDKTTPLFLAIELDTKTDGQKPISTAVVRRIVRKYAKMADLKKPVSPETLRRTYKILSCECENLDA